MGMKFHSTLGQWVLGACIGFTFIVPAAAADKRFDGITLRVGTFGASWKTAQEKLIVKKFESLGGKIQFVTGSPQSNFAKLVAGRGRLPFDMMEVLDAQEADFMKGGFLAPIDLAKIPNTTQMAKSLYNNHLIANWYTQEGICYLKEKLAELGVKPPAKYGDLADAKFAGKVLLPDINSGGGLAFMGAIAYEAGGDEKNIKPGLELITSIKPKRFWSQGSEVLTQFQTGDIVAAGAHVGWCLRAAKAGSVVAFSHPEIKPGVKGTAKQGFWGIMKGSPNIDAAHWYLNEFVSPEFQYEFAVLTGIVPVSGPALKRLSEVPIMKDMAETDPDKIAKQLKLDFSKVDLSAWNDQWNRTVTKVR